MFVNMSAVADVPSANTGVNECPEKAQADHRKQ